MKYTDHKKTVTAKNYQEAAEKLYGQTYYPNPKGGGLVPTTYVVIHRGYADVEVFKVGDKLGTYWGVAKAHPKRHTLYRIKD